MADSLPSPPLSRAESPESKQHPRSPPDELVSRLDELLEQYLELLDEYTKLREELGKSFSDGFFSLANAQRTSTLGAGRRYGQEGYDERMKASRRVEIRTEKPKKRNTDDVPTSVGDEVSALLAQSSHIFRIVPHESKNVVQPATKRDEGASSRTDNSDKIITIQDTVIDENERPNHSKAKPDPSYRDPATWFGILVPQHLRQTQKSFVTSIETTVPNLVTTKSVLEALEQEIWRVRTALGIEGEYRIQDDG